MNGTDLDRRGPPARSEPPSHTLSTAWVSLAVLAAAVPLGRWASTEFLAARGYDAVDETEPPGLGLLSFLVLVAIVLPPALLALWAGARARRHGHPSGVVVLVVAGLVTGLTLVGLPVYLSRLVGWTVALGIIAGLAMIVWFSRPRRWGHPSGARHD